MERFRLFSVILQVIIGLNGVKGEDPAHDFCVTKLQFISIFNLGEHILFQDNYRQIWKLNESDIMGPDDTVITMIEKTVKLEEQMKDLLSEKYTLKYPLFGFTAIEDDDDCNSTDPLEQEECIDVSADPNIHYTCFYGQKVLEYKPLIEAYIYNYSSLEPFSSESLRNRVLKYCKNNSVSKIARLTGDPEEDIQLSGGLQYYEYDVEHNYTRLRRQLLISPVYNESANESFVNLYAFYEEFDEENNATKDLTYTNTFPYDSLFYAFRYNQHFGVFGCSLNCDIKTNLTALNVVKDEGNVTRIIDRTIEDLIRCPIVKPWYPNEFCHQKGFISIFNLGKNVIFQNPGKFWHFISSGANQRGNIYFDGNIQSIRFDTDLLLFLDYYFDTSLPIYGFTFEQETKDMCQSGTESVKEKCQEFFKNCFAKKNIPYYRACIYGQSLVVKDFKLSHQDKSMAFRYSPSGLALLENDEISRQTSEFCERVSRSLGTDFQMTGILGDIFLNPDSNTDVYAMFKNLGTGSIHYYKTTIQLNADLSEAVNWTQLHVMPSKNETDIDLMSYIAYDEFILGLSPRNLSEKPIYHSMSALCARYDWSTGKFERLLHSLYSIFDCPFNQSYSIAYMEEEENLCTDFNGVFSIFQIGRITFLQRGRRFYRAVLYLESKRFVFDKYFTDLMNDDFDTRYKVLGYSYLIERERLYYFRAFIVGRTKDATKSLGPKIFRAYTVYDSPFSPLVALNDAFQLYRSDITFGLKDPTLSFTRFNGLVYFNKGFTPLKKISHIDDDDFFILVAVLNDTQTFVGLTEEGFEFGFQPKSKQALKLYDRLQVLSTALTDIFGLFEYNHSIYAAGWRWPLNNESRRETPVIVKFYSFEEGFFEGKGWLELKDMTFVNFFEFFVCKFEAKSSESNSDDNNDVLYFFIVLIVLLLLTGGVVGLIIWDNKKPIGESSPKSKDKSIKSLKASEDPINPNQNKKNVLKSSQSTDQKTPKTKPLPKNKDNKDLKTGSQLSDTDSSHSSTIQIRSDIGD